MKTNKVIRSSDGKIETHILGGVYVERLSHSHTDIFGNEIGDANKGFNWSVGSMVFRNLQSVQEWILKTRAEEYRKEQAKMTPEQVVSWHWNRNREFDASNPRMVEKYRGFYASVGYII